MFVVMIMDEFIIDAELRRGVTPLQVEVVPADRWTMPACPQFVVTYFNEQQVCVVTLQLENGVWYDQDTRLLENQLFSIGLESRAPKAYDPAYRSPLEVNELRNIGHEISKRMTVQLTAWLSLFTPTYPAPVLN